MADLPIIVLAFANEQSGGQYLRDLPRELRMLRQILEEAERNGLCELKELSNATLDEIIDVFNRHRDQVAVLHYGGHADSGQLLLESNTGIAAAAHAAGLAAFLGHSRGLQLVFLNGCSTRAQAARLLDAGVASVITTARSIDDEVARKFAVAFYTQLSSGQPLRAAFDLARSQILAAKGDDPQSYYRTRELVDAATATGAPEPVDDQGFPWDFRAGTEMIERWSLPDAAGNPEFGLPPLPQRDLPICPFRHLAWFTAEQAEVFFGRGYQVRELYDAVTDTSGQPVVFLYGASGVGKSSLLDAGLVPRLGAGGYAVRYQRRDQTKGLLKTLQDMIGLDSKQGSLNEAWRAEEARLKMPLVIFLDQVEEALTRPDPTQPHELDDFLGALAETLGKRETRPQGKLVLGFRKEWLAEIERRLTESNLQANKVFMKQLDRRAIIEAIRGPARPGRLQRQYRLAIEEGLPEVIADDLLVDAGSALAPTLQVLLTKMWERARQSNPDQPRFDRAIYESLKSQGYLLKDLLDEGFQGIRAWNPSVEESGLALDVLAYHTTDLGTASARTRAELLERYAHQAEALEGLLRQGKDHYLLIEAESPADAPTRSTRLAHDLLAPILLQRFRLSARSGQRARRILENRVSDWADNKIGPDLDSADLAIVHEGKSGMRVWTSDEIRLIHASEIEDERIKAQEAEKSRRLREAEAGRLAAEAQTRQLTEDSLKEQQAANLRLADANLREKLKSKRLRDGSIALGIVATVMVIVAIYAAIQKSTADKQRDLARSNLEAARKARKQLDIASADELLTALPQAVPEILPDVRTRPDALERLREVRAKLDSTDKKSGRAALAFLEQSPSATDFLLGQILSPESDPAELVMVSPFLSKHLTADHLRTLWKVVENLKIGSAIRLRNAAILARAAPGDPRWASVADRIVNDLLTVNVLELHSWTDAFRAVKAPLKGSLVKQFTRGEANERKVAATILDDYASDDILLILQLLKVADTQQFPILFKKALAHKDEAVKSMNEEVAFDLIKTADERQFPIVFAKAKDDPTAAVKSMKDEVARVAPPLGSSAQKDILAGRQANALITLALLGESKLLWPALGKSDDPRLRTYLIHRMGRLGVDHKELAQHLFEETEPTIRAAIVLALGQYPYDIRRGEINALVVSKLVPEYKKNPDPGFHAAVAWLLPYLNCFEGPARDLKPSGQTPESGRTWYVDKNGWAFIVFKNPGVFEMGSPPEEVNFGRNTNEEKHLCRIPRSFALASREVSVADYFQFLEDPVAKEAKKHYIYADQRDYSPDQAGPIVSVTWFEAVKFCRWLGDREKLRESEQCYPPIDQIKEGMVLTESFLLRSGYRLPTEAEWEFACRAGASTPWSFGSDRTLLKDLASYLNNSVTKRERTQARRSGWWPPNAFGLFDMMGNVNEWCSDRNPTYPTTYAPPVNDLGNERPDRAVLDADIRIYRGGSFADLSPNLRSAYRDGARPSNRFPGVGFRLARTISPDSP